MRKNLGNKTLVCPLPVFIIATYDENGVPNAMNAAWGTQWNYHEVSILLAPHKTTDNLKLKKAFTLAFATKETLQISDYFGLESGRRVNKIEKAGVHVEKSQFVDAPVISDYPLVLECEVVEMRPVEEDFQVIGRVVNVTADESILNDKGEVDIGKMNLLTFDSAANVYRLVGAPVGHAFQDGLTIKNK